MNYGLYLSASAMRINSQRIDVMANNLANVRTNAFKQDFTVIKARPAVPEALGMPGELSFPLLDRMAGGMTLGGTHTDFRQGNLQTTDSDLDLALDGDGFFVVDADGQRAYTRDGRLARDTEGYLVTAEAGHRLLDEDGQPIQASAGGPISIDPEGRVTSAAGEARLAVVLPDAAAGLHKVGNSLYRTVGPADELAASAKVRQGMVEDSGTEPFATMVDLIAAQRAYDASARMMRQADSMLGRAVNDIARTT